MDEKRRHVAVGPDLRVRNTTNAFALGDCAASRVISDRAIHSESNRNKFSGMAVEMAMDAPKGGVDSAHVSLFPQCARTLMHGRCIAHALVYATLRLCLRLRLCDALVYAIGSAMHATRLAHCFPTFYILLLPFFITFFYYLF